MRMPVLMAQGSTPPAVLCREHPFPAPTHIFLANQKLGANPPRATVASCCAVCCPGNLCRSLMQCTTPALPACANAKRSARVTSCVRAHKWLDQRGQATPRATTFRASAVRLPGNVRVQARVRVLARLLVRATARRFNSTQLNRLPTRLCQTARFTRKLPDHRSTAAATRS